MVVVDSRSGRVVNESCCGRAEPWSERRKLVIAVWVGSVVEVVTLWVVSMIQEGCCEFGAV